MTSLCEKYGCVVVVEDDLEVSPDFLKFMFNALERYSDDEDVMQVAGHTIAPPDDLKKDAFFLPITTTWGWGTWDRAWKHFLGILKIGQIKKMMQIGRNYSQ